MVDKFCWLGPGGNKPFDSKLNEWNNSKLTKRSICVLEYVRQHSPINIDEYNENIIRYLNDNGVGSNNLNRKHTYGPLLFVRFISKNESILEITDEGIEFLDNIKNGKFDKATEIYLDQLFMANFETEATKDVEISAFPVQIMFKILFEKEFIPLFMFQTHIQYIKDYSDLVNCLSLLDNDCFFSYIQELQNFYKDDAAKFKSIYTIGTEKWRSYVIGGLLNLGIFDKASYNKGYLKFTDYGRDYVNKKDIDNISYESMFY
ncbi:MAG: hypothetical protein IKV87_07855 [Methanobrevibacter sp.]|nr:hypothetical protein [Methanobrevibacter sp.]